MQRVEASAEKHGSQLKALGPQVVRVVSDGDRMQVHYAKEGLAQLLGRGVLAEASAVVPEVLCAGGLNAREDSQYPSIIPNAGARP